jgi:hypothetical protein
MDQSDLPAIFSLYESQFLLDVDKFGCKQLRIRLPFLPPKVLCRILSIATAVFTEEPTLHSLSGSFIVVGALHGSILDLLRIFRHCGSPKHRCYLFLGNLVNGGEFSVQVLALILLSKILFPGNVFVLRGSEEFAAQCDSGGFREELAFLYGPQSPVYGACLACFGALPLAAVLNGHYFCVSGGIGPRTPDVDSVRGMARSSPAAAELCCSEPTAFLPMFLPSAGDSADLFGRAAVAQFLARSHLQCLVRGHATGAPAPELSFDGQCVTVAGALIVRDRAHEAVAFPPYAPLRRTDATYVASAEAGRYAVAESSGIGADVHAIAREALPASAGLRLTVSRTGPARPPQTAVNQRPAPLPAGPQRRLYSPVVKHLSFPMADA